MSDRSFSLVQASARSGLIPSFRNRNPGITPPGFTTAVIVATRDRGFARSRGARTRGDEISALAKGK